MRPTTYPVVIKREGRSHLSSVVRHAQAGFEVAWPDDVLSLGLSGAAGVLAVLAPCGSPAARRLRQWYTPAAAGYEPP